MSLRSQNAVAEVLEVSGDLTLSNISPRMVLIDKLRDEGCTDTTILDIVYPLEASSCQKILDRIRKRANKITRLSHGLEFSDGWFTLD